MKKMFKKSVSGRIPRQRLRSDDDHQTPASFSYHARRSDLELNVGRQVQRETPPTRSKGKLHNFVPSRIGGLILLLAVVVSAVNIMSLSGNAKVVPLSSGGEIFLNSNVTYEAAANKLLADSILNRNKITIDAGRITRELLHQYPELSSVSITVPLLAHRPLIYIQPATPAIILAASNGTYVLSTTGKALSTDSQSPAVSKLALPVVGDQSGLKVSISQQALTSTSVSFIQQVSAQLAAKKFTVVAMTLPTSTSELDVQLAGQPYSIKFNLQSNTPREQVGTFLATIAQLQRQNAVPGKYIDVRVEGRAYYQ